MKSNGKKIALIGAPTDVGAGSRGGSMGPEAMRVAGLLDALAHLGYRVVDKGNLSGPLTPYDEPVEGYRHLAEALTWCERVRDACYDSLKQNTVPILLGGDHSLAIGSISAAAHYCQEVGKKLHVLWLDAHADFNTAETSPSGNIHGMPLAVLYGRGHPDFKRIYGHKPYQPPAKVIQVGVRSVDIMEKVMLGQADITVFDMRMIDELGMRAVMKTALELVADQNAHLHVSFDVDFLDPSIAPGVATTVSGGPTYREAQLCMEMIYDSGLLGSLDIMELNPAFDEHNKTAKLTVELVESLFGKQILARKSVH